MVWFVYVEHVV